MAEKEYGTYILWVSPHNVLDMLNWKQYRAVRLPVLQQARNQQGELVPIPNDVTVGHVFYEPLRKQFGLYLEHESFPVVPSGEELPRLSMDCFGFELRDIAVDGEDFKANLFTSEHFSCNQWEGKE